MAAPSSGSAARIDIKAVSAAALRSLPDLLADWLPGGRREGHEYVVRNPTRADGRPVSFTINTASGRWSDFATGDRGGDAVALFAYLNRTSQVEAARAVADRLGLSRPEQAANDDPLARMKAHAERKASGQSEPERDPWTPVTPIPEADFVPLDVRLGGREPGKTWLFSDAEGLRKAREGAVLHGAAGAGGATPEKASVLNIHPGRDGGPTAEIRVGPLGPPVDPGPTGPKSFQTVGPTCSREEVRPNQQLEQAGPIGPIGPSEKQHVREIVLLRAATPVLRPGPVSDTPQGWRDGLARLGRWTPPCEGFRSGEWEAVHRAVAHFMDHYAAKAAARGWAALDLFGVHGLAGAARVDSCGALMLPLLRNATALTADAITFGPLVYRRRPMPEAVLVWDLIGDAA